MNQNQPPRPQLQLRAGLLVMLLAAGCNTYGEVSPGEYELAKAAYSICNREDAAGLDGFEKALSAARTSQKITDSEAGWFTEIVDQARSGEWTDASAAARRMLDEQVQK